MAIKKILAIRVGRSGDIVMITAALKALLKKYPDADIDVLTSPDGKRLLTGFDRRLHITYVHERKALFEYFKRREIIKNIAKQAYDCVYCFELNPSFSQFYRYISAEIFQLQQTDRLMNYAERCLELVSGKVESGSEHDWIWLPVTEAGRDKAKEILREVDINPNTIVVGFHPSFSGLRKSWVRSLGHREEKAWPEENFGVLAVELDKYAQENGLDLVVIMDLVEEDRALGERIVKASHGVVKMLIPPLNFDRYKATLERMNVLVVPNTGPMHIAGAVGTNLVALFGHLNPVDSGPYVDEHKATLLTSAGSESAGVAGISIQQVFEACKPYL